MENNSCCSFKMAKFVWMNRAAVWSTSQFLLIRYYYYYYYYCTTNPNKLEGIFFQGRGCGHPCPPLDPPLLTKLLRWGN